MDSRLGRSLGATFLRSSKQPSFLLYAYVNCPQVRVRGSLLCIPLQTIGASQVIQSGLSTMSVKRVYVWICVVFHDRCARGTHSSSYLEALLTPSGVHGPGSGAHGTSSSGACLTGWGVSPPA